jgi:DNA-binding GntR family transcriptional regulator
VAETLAGPLPPYMQIANILRDEISAGTYDVTRKLPTSRELIKRFGVTNQPINNAIRILRDEGLVTTSQQGTFLSAQAGETARRHGDDANMSSGLVSATEALAEIRATLARLEARVSALEDQQDS